MKTKLITLFLCLCPLMLCAQDYKKEGDELFQQAQYEKAIKKYKAYIAFAGEDPAVSKRIANAQKCNSLLSRAKVAEQAASESSSYEKYEDASSLYNELYSLHSLASYKSKATQLQNKADAIRIAHKRAEQAERERIAKEQQRADSIRQAQARAEQKERERVEREKAAREKEILEQKQQQRRQQQQREEERKNEIARQKEEANKHKQLVNEGIKNGFVLGHECVDLGLSVAWATCNVGATSSKKKGTIVKGKTASIGSDWGDDWRLPTWAECNELMRNCTFQEVGFPVPLYIKVTSKINGGSMILPAYVRLWTSVEPFYWDAKETRGMNEPTSSSYDVVMRCVISKY